VSDTGCQAAESCRLVVVGALQGLLRLQSRNEQCTRTKAVAETRMVSTAASSGDLFLLVSASPFPRGARGSVVRHLLLWRF
jgi:hypothetical protein